MRDCLIDCLMSDDDLGWDGDDGDDGDDMMTVMTVYWEEVRYSRRTWPWQGEGWHQQ